VQQNVTGLGPQISDPFPVIIRTTCTLLALQAERGSCRRLVLTCSLKHTNHFDPDCLVVKANRSGTQARIVFAADTDIRQDDEPNDKLLLPYTVDPYSLTAQLHGDNSLVIEAPISPSVA